MDDRPGHAIRRVVSPAERDLERTATQVAMGAFCREMGRSTNQGEVGLVIDNVYHAIRPE